MANFLNYIVESSIQPVKTNVLWIKNGVPYYFNKKWKPLLGSGSGGGPGESVDSPIQFGEGEYSAILKNSNSRALNDYALALGYNTVSNNPSETAFGKFNKSVSSSDFSKATLFSIGNGTTNLLKNAFEVKFDGSIYIEGINITLQKYLENLTNEDLQFYSEITRIDDELKVIKDSIDIAVGEGFSEFIEQFENSIKRIEVLEDKTVENSTKITQSAEQIQSIATRVTATEESLIQQESKITQTAESITSEVSRIETKYDNELKTVKESTSSIDQKADSINLKVESLEGTLNSKTSELEGKITKNTSEIALNKEQIGLKVNTDVFDELAGTVEQQGASIEINTNSIKNKVEQSNFNAFTGEVNNKFTEVNQSIEGITTTVQDNTGKITVIEETVDGLTSKTGTLEAEIESLKKQSDGSIDTHFGTTAPTLDNEPAVNWDTDELKNEHTGDIYYNNNTGEAFRFSYDPQTNTYFWVELTDSALTDALDKISKLEEAIDGKVTIFYTQPSNYKYGDIWFVHNSSYSPYKEGSLLTATNLAKDAVVESFNLNHWVLKADIVKSLNDLDKTVTDAFKDNIITIAEVDAIKESKKAFEASFQELTSAHTIVIATTLGNSTKLKTAYSNLESKYNAFIQSIDSLVLDSNGNLSDVLLQAYTTAYNDYVEALKNYSKAKEELTDSIQRELSSANDYIKDISSDGVITPIEKKNLIEIWRSIAEEFNTNKGIAVNYKIIDSEGNERTDIYSDGVYYSNYALYKAAFDEIKTIFTSDVFGISNTTTSTALPEGYSTNTIDDALNNYYDTLSVFAEMISKITIEITDAHEKVLQLSKELQEQLSPSDNITQIGKGVILSSIIGVQSNGVLQAGLNATNVNGLVDTSKDNHGRVVFAGGINGVTDWNSANTVIYEDGYVHFRWGEIDEGVEIGNALIRSVVSGTIDLFSYPENGALVPLFIVNKDDTGKIVSISTPYDFIANKNLIVHGDTSSGGEGGSSSVGIQGILLNGTTYRDENGDGIIDLGTIGGGTLTEITYEMIVEALGYTPLSTSGGTITSNRHDVLRINSSYSEGSIAFSRLYIAHSDADKAFVGWDSDNGTILYNNSGKYLGIKNDGTPYYYSGNGAYNTLYHTGNFNPANYLPLSGGTINGDLNINGYLTTDKTRIRLGAYYIFVSSDVWKVSDANWQNDYTLLHAGNYSDYALRLSGNQYYRFADSSGETGVLTQDTSVNNTWYIVGKTGDYNILLHSGNIGDYALKTDGSNVMMGNIRTHGYLEFLNESNSTIGVYNVNAGNNTPIYLYNGAWKTIAFTDSNVDSATLANKANNLVDSTGKYLIYVSSAGNLMVGDNIYTAGDTHILGKNIHLRYGASASYGLILNSSGNVFIGSNYTGTQIGTTFGIISAGDKTADIFLGYNGERKWSITSRSASSSEANGFGIYNHTNGKYSMLINSSGNVLIGTTTDSGYKLDVNGTAAVGNNIDGGDLLVFHMDRAWRFQQAGTGAASALVLRTLENSKWFYLRNSVNESALGFFASSGLNKLYAYCPVEIQSGLSVSGAVTMASYLKVDSYIDITGTSRLRGNVTMDGDVHMGNNKGFYFKNSAGSGALSLFLSSSNVLGIAYSNIASVNIGVATTIEGALTVGAGATINGNLVVQGDISA